MMKLQLAYSLNTILVPPSIRLTIRTRSEKTMKHGEENRTLHWKLEMAIGKKFLDHLPTSCLLPNPLEDHRGTDTTARNFERFFSLVC